MSDASKSNSELLLYQTEDGRTRIQCRFEHETVWMTQAQMAELFQTTPQNMTLHLKAIFAEGELAEAATCWTEVLPREQLPRKLHEAIQLARARLAKETEASSRMRKLR